MLCYNVASVNRGNCVFLVLVLVAGFVVFLPLLIFVVLVISTQTFVGNKGATSHGSLYQSWVSLQMLCGIF